MADAPAASSESALRVAGLIGGPLLAAIAFALLPGGLGGEGRATAAVATLMAVWWLTEAIPITATALLPLALFPLLGVSTIQAAAAPYGDKVIFLFLGGFLLGAAMERSGLHRRIALVTLLGVGTRPDLMVGGCMLASALISMWVSNTATAAMMLPIGLSLVAFVRAGGREGSAAGFATAMVLGIAYAATIGGTATLIGTPPNVVFKGFVDTHYGQSVSFVGWMLLGVPLVAVFLPVAWFYLTRIAFPVRGVEVRGGRGEVRQRLRDLGPMGRDEWAVFVVFLGAAASWIFRARIAAIGPLGPLRMDLLTDEGIAVIAALLLFVIPVARRPLRFAMDWTAARELPWGTLILFGGGLSLAAAIQSSGLDAFLGKQFEVLRGAPPWAVVLAVATFVIFLTELTSNTAVATTLMPVLAGAAAGIGVRAELLLVPAALGASLAFMLPVGTPPNALAFGTGHVSVRQMARAGFWLNIISIAIVTAGTLLISGPALRLRLDPP